MKHDWMVRVMAERLRSRRWQCLIVLAEPRARIDEHPDAIGWDRYGFSTLVECKTHRDDFLAEWRRLERKAFRRQPDLGMGDERYYAARPGLIRPDEVKEVGWGLLEIHPGGQVYRRVDSGRFNADKRAEVRLLVRRAADGMYGRPPRPDALEQLALGFNPQDQLFSNGAKKSLDGWKRSG